MTFFQMLCQPFNRLKRLATPPCEECVHFLASHTPKRNDLCLCPRYLNYINKLNAERYDSADTNCVRGTFFCKFKRKGKYEN